MKDSNAPILGSSAMVRLFARLQCFFRGHVQRWSPDDADRYCRRCQCNLYPHETRRRVMVRNGHDAGRRGTVFAEYPPDYSTVMLDGFTRLQAFREHEICDEPNAEVSDRRAHATEINQDANGGSLH